VRHSSEGRSVMNTLQSFALRLVEKAVLPGPDERMPDEESEVLTAHLASLAARPYDDLLAMRGKRHRTLVGARSGTSFVVTVSIEDHPRSPETLLLMAALRRPWTIRIFQWLEVLPVDRNGPVVSQCPIPQRD